MGNNKYQERIDAQKSRIDEIRAALEDKPDIRKDLDQKSANLDGNKVSNPGKDVPDKKK